MTRRVLIVNANQFGYHTDYYYFAYYLRGGYDVHYICYDRKRERVDLDGINIVYLSFPRFRIFRSIYFLTKTLQYIRSARIDLVFTNYFCMVGFIGVLAGRRRKILDIRSGSLKRDSFARKWGNLNIRLASKAFDSTTVLSEGLAGLINLKKYTLLPLGSDTYFAGDHALDTLKLLYVGTLHERKIEETIEGVALFLRINPQVSVTYDIVGFGTEADVNAVKHAVGRNRLEKIVSFHGRKTLPELRSFFEKCNVGVSYIPIAPWYDNQPPTKTFEYVLSGMICIGTSTSENKKYLNDINGVLCEDNPQGFTEALSEVWEKRGNFQADNIRRTLSDYTWERIVETKLKPVLSIPTV